MTVSALEATPRRDRLVVGASLIAVTVVAWFYLLWLGHSMGMDGGMVMAPAYQPWDATRFVFMFVMWAVMMVGMMTPSAAPVILLYARVGRQAERQGKPLAATGYFAAGYLAAWTVFSVAATLAQWALEYALLLSPAMTAASRGFGGLLLVAAGIYQWTPVKDACLNHCRSPLSFILFHGGFRRGGAGSVLVGFRHGLYCVGCCWALMALLLVGGVMNVMWIAGLAIFVLLEKIVPGARWLPRVAGLVLATWGIWLLTA